MKSSNRPSTPLLELLENDFASGALTRDTAHEHHVTGEYRTVTGVPRALWEKALLAPAREFLQRPGKEFRARLVAACWRLAGGNPASLPAELPLVVEILHAGSLIVDDIQDQSIYRRGEPALHRIVGTPLAINTGNWLYFWSLVVLERNLPQAVAAAVQARASKTLMRCHQGQALDLAARVYDLAQGDMPAAVATATGLKTGALMEFAAILGASAAGASAEQRDILGRFGYGLGVGLQMLDDLGCLVARARRRKAVEDLRAARLTWPWAWLAEIADSREFVSWQERARVVAENRAGQNAGQGRDEGGLDQTRECKALLDDMAECVAIPGRRRVAEYLSEVMAELRAGLGPSCDLGDVEEEIARLEKSYHG